MPHKRIALLFVIYFAVAVINLRSGEREGSKPHTPKAYLFLGQLLRCFSLLWVNSQDGDQTAKLPTRNEVQRIAANIDKLPAPKRGPDGDVGAEVLPKLIGRALPTLRPSRVQRKA